MTSTIDWTGQLEAYHEDGRVVAVNRIPSPPGTLHVGPTLEGGWFAFMLDGQHIVDRCPWRIRNTPETPSQAPQVTPPILPSTEQLDRFEALLGRLEGILGAINKGEAA